MQENATSAGLPLPQTGRPFYFVEVSEVPAKSASPLHALPPRAMYTRTSQLCTAQPQHAFPVIALPEDFWRMLLSGGSLLTETSAGKCSELEAHNLEPTAHQGFTVQIASPRVQTPRAPKSQASKNSTSGNNTKSGVASNSSCSCTVVSPSKAHTPLLLSLRCKSNN